MKKETIRGLFLIFFLFLLVGINIHEAFKICRNENMAIMECMKEYSLKSYNDDLFTRMYSHCRQEIENEKIK